MDIIFKKANRKNGSTNEASTVILARSLLERQSDTLFCTEAFKNTMILYSFRFNAFFIERFLPSFSLISLPKKGITLPPCFRLLITHFFLKYKIMPRRIRKTKSRLYIINTLIYPKLCVSLRLPNVHLYNIKTARCLFILIHKP